MKKHFDSKQQMREDFERRTDPNGPLDDQLDGILSSAMAAGLIGVRNGLSLLKRYTGDEHDFPCEEHKEFTRKVMDGMKERMIAFELELINVLVDLAWEVHECECDHCRQMDSELDAVDKARKAPFN